MHVLIKWVKPCSGVDGGWGLRGFCEIILCGVYTSNPNTKRNNFLEGKEKHDVGL